MSTPPSTSVAGGHRVAVANNSTKPSKAPPTTTTTTSSATIANSNKSAPSKNNKPPSSVKGSSERTKKDAPTVPTSSSSTSKSSTPTGISATVSSSSSGGKDKASSTTAPKTSKVDPFTTTTTSATTNSTCPSKTTTTSTKNAHQSKTASSSKTPEKSAKVGTTGNKKAVDDDQEDYGSGHDGGLLDEGLEVDTMVRKLVDGFADNEFKRYKKSKYFKEAHYDRFDSYKGDKKAYKNMILDYCLFDKKQSDAFEQFTQYVYENEGEKSLKVLKCIRFFKSVTNYTTRKKFWTLVHDGWDTYLDQSKAGYVEIDSGLYKAIKDELDRNWDDKLKKVRDL